MLKAIMDSLDGLSADIAALYTERNGKFELAGIEGVKTQADVDRLQSALTKERTDHKGLKDKLTLLGDRKIEDVVTLLDKIPELEAAAKGNIDDAKLNELVEGRIKSRTAPLERELSTLKTQLTESNTLVAQFQGEKRQRTVGDAIRSAASKLKVVDTAIEDVILLGERVFDIDEGGAIVTKDGVGVTPGIGAEAWLTDMQAKRPHWWGPSVGGGSAGNRGGAGGVVNPWGKDSWNMTQQAAVYKESPEKAAQLAKAAGTSVGGPRPA